MEFPIWSPDARHQTIGTCTNQVLGTTYSIVIVRCTLEGSVFRNINFAPYCGTTEDTANARCEGFPPGHGRTGRDAEAVA